MVSYEMAEKKARQIMDREYSRHSSDRYIWIMNESGKLEEAETCYTFRPTTVTNDNDHEVQWLLGGGPDQYRIDKSSGLLYRRRDYGSFWSLVFVLKMRNKECSTDQLDKLLSRVGASEQVFCGQNWQGKKVTLPEDIEDSLKQMAIFGSRVILIRFMGPYHIVARDRYKQYCTNDPIQLLFDNLTSVELFKTKEQIEVGYCSIGMEIKPEGIFLDEAIVYNECCNLFLTQFDYIYNCSQEKMGDVSGDEGENGVAPHYSLDTFYLTLISSMDERSDGSNTGVKKILALHQDQGFMAVSMLDEIPFVGRDSGIDE